MHLLGGGDGGDGFMKDTARTGGAPATAVPDTQPLAQLSHGTAAVGNRIADVAFGDRIADADVHEGAFELIVYANHSYFRYDCQPFGHHGLTGLEAKAGAWAARPPAAKTAGSIGTRRVVDLAQNFRPGRRDNGTNDKAGRNNGNGWDGTLLRECLSGARTAARAPDSQIGRAHV